MRVLLISVDGMRPDALVAVPQAQEILKRAAFTLEGTTVDPSVTLPCHVSMFHSVDPARHGTTTNVYAPQVRPITGLFEVVKQRGLRSAFFYGWEELRDISRPGSLDYSLFCSGREIGREAMNNILTDAAIKHLTETDTDFTFLYLGYTDWAGHKYSWMSKEYMAAMDNSWQNIARILQVLPEDMAVVITADHGGHDRTHGTLLPEDMTIPVILLGAGIPVGKDIAGASIKDIAPTVTALLGIDPDEEWEGRSLL